MQIVFGGVAAACRHCAADEFEPLPMSGLLARDKRFRCVVCNTEFEYGELLLHIGEQVIKEVRKAHPKGGN